MKSKILGLMLTVACLLTLAAATIKASNQSAVGVWRLDVQKSSYGNMPAPKFEQLVVNVDQPDAVKWNLKGVGTDSKGYISSYDGPIDGKDHHMMSNEAASTVAYTRTATGLQWVVKDKNGAVIETGSSQLSADGKTLTLKGTTEGPNGKAEFVSVFNRTQ